MDDTVSLDDGALLVFNENLIYISNKQLSCHMCCTNLCIQKPSSVNRLVS